MKAFSLRVLFVVLTVTCTGSVLADEPVEIPSARLDVFLVPKAGQKEFVVAHTDEEFTKMLQLYAPSVQPFKPRPPPIVNFGERIVVAYFWLDFPCQPYRIGRVLQYLDRVTVEIIHSFIKSGAKIASARPLLWQRPQPSASRESTSRLTTSSNGRRVPVAPNR